MNIDIEKFEFVSGISFFVLIRKFDTKDEWATFLKIAAVIESSTKRSIGIRLDLDPNLESINRLEFFNSLNLGRDLKIISNEAYSFANRIRIIRNDLVHQIGELDLNIEKLKADTSTFTNYKKIIEDYVKIGETSITDSPSSHFNFLISGCIGYVQDLSDRLYPKQRKG